MKYLKEELPCKFVKSILNNVSGIYISVFFFSQRKHTILSKYLLPEFFLALKIVW